MPKAKARGTGPVEATAEQLDGVRGGAVTPVGGGVLLQDGSVRGPAPPPKGGGGVLTIRDPLALG